jgi:hypothetical protein
MKRILLVLSSFAVMVIGLAASSYSYTGPNRTTAQTVWAGGPVLGEVCTFSSGTWHYVVEKSYACDTPGNPWETEYPDYYYGCSSAYNNNRVYENNCYQTTKSVNLPPATVSGSTSCAQPGSNGWCQGGATLSLSSSEPVSGWSITGIESIAGMLCAGSSCAWSFPQGDTSLIFWALSSHGDTSLSSSASMQFDSVPPVIAYADRTAPNVAGWNSTDVVVDWNCADATSGADSASVSQVVSSEGANLSATGTCADLAGNTGSNTQTGINIDKTPPDATFALNGPLGTNGWYTGDVTITASGTDISTPIVCTPDQFQTADTTGAVFTGSCTNAAGLTTNIAPITIRRDTTDPVVTAKANRSPDSNGWYNHPVSVSFSGIDTTQNRIAQLHPFPGRVWTMQAISHRHPSRSSMMPHRQF